MTTPIDRLRELHRPCPRPNCNSLYSHCDLCGQGAMGWPCDTIAALDALEDPRPRLPWRCTGCGAKADEVQWAAIDSIYYDGHTVGISEPDLCGPFRMPGDETEPLREENKQLQVRLDAATALIWGAQMDEHMNHGASLKRAALRACEHPNCAPYRDWLAGDKEAGNE